MQEQTVIWCEICHENHVQIGEMILCSPAVNVSWETS